LNYFKEPIMIASLDVDAICGGFGRPMRTIRWRLGWSLAQMAKRTGTTKDWLSHVENGRRLPSFRSILVLASALGCGVDDLLGVPLRKRDISVDDSLRLDEYSI
jgi:transcriptional regulator with XRE-family HTH domain